MPEMSALLCAPCSTSQALTRQRCARAGGPLTWPTDRVRRGMVAKTPFPLLVETIRTGPPRMSVYGIPGADARLNFAEFFVHHEDVRRAQPDWEPRPLDPAVTDLIWKDLSRARLVLRKVPVGIEFARDDLPDGAAEHQPV